MGTRTLDEVVDEAIMGAADDGSDDVASYVADYVHEAIAHRKVDGYEVAVTEIDDDGMPIGNQIGGWRATPNGLGVELLEPVAVGEDDLEAGLVELRPTLDTTEKDLGSLLGRLLSIADAISEDRERRSSIKSLIRQMVGAWYDGLIEKARADSPWLEEARRREMRADGSDDDVDEERDRHMGEWLNELLAVQQALNDADTSENLSPLKARLVELYERIPSQVIDLANEFGRHGVIGVGGAASFAEPYCSALSPPKGSGRRSFMCTRPLGHKGRHEALDRETGEKLDSWAG